MCIRDRCIVRTTENIQFSPAPRNTFSRSDELKSSDNQIHHGNEHFWPKVVVDLFFSSECFSTLYAQYTRKMLLSECGWYYFNKPFLRAAFESHWDLRGRTFSDLKKKRKMTEDTSEKPSPGRHREVSKFVKPTCKIKKTGRETLPLAIPQVELLSEFYGKRNVDRFSVHNGRFWADFGQILCWVLGDHP